MKQTITLNKNDELTLFSANDKMQYLIITVDEYDDLNIQRKMNKIVKFIKA